MSKNQKNSLDSLKRKQDKMEKSPSTKNTDLEFNSWKKIRRNEESTSKYYYRPSTSNFGYSSLPASYEIESHSRTFRTRDFEQNLFLKRPLAFRPSRGVRNFPISSRRGRYPSSIRRGRSFNKSPVRELKDVQIYGKPRFFPPTYDISPDRSSVKTPDVFDPVDLREMMRKAKENENLDEYYRCRDLLNEMLKTPPEPIGKPKYHKPVYDVSPVRTRCKTPEILDTIELRKLMRNAKKNENLDQYHYYRDLLNKLFDDPMYRLKQKNQVMENNNSEEIELEELDCVDELEEKEVYENDAKTNNIEVSKEHLKKPMEEKNIKKEFSKKKLNASFTKKNTEKLANLPPQHRKSEKYELQNVSRTTNSVSEDEGNLEDEDDVFLQFQEEGLDMDAMTKAADSKLLGKQQIEEHLSYEDEELDLSEIFESGRLGLRSFFHQKSDVCKPSLKDDEEVILYAQNVLKLKDDNKSLEEMQNKSENLKQPISLSQMSFTKFIELFFKKAKNLE